MSYTPFKVDCEVNIDKSVLSGKTAIVTGGADGLGRAYVRALHATGVQVCVGHMNAEQGEKLASGLPGLKFVQYDVTNWEDQVNLFRTTASMTPSGTIDHVVANDGIAIDDKVFSYDVTSSLFECIPATANAVADGSGVPIKASQPKTIEVNLHGALYITKLAMHSFIRQNGTNDTLSSQSDTSLTLIGSGAAFLDCPRGVQYKSTKWGARGIMHALRRTAHYHGSCLNMTSH